MKDPFNIKLPGHKYYGSKDILFEWKEPVAIQKTIFARDIRRCLWTIPILFPIFAMVGFFMFAAKVFAKGHSLKELSWQELLVISALLATLLSLFAVAQVVLKRFSPTLVRLASTGIGKWKSGWGLEFSCEYTEIREIKLTNHNLVPEARALLVILSAENQVYLAIPDGDIAKATDVLKQKGIQCDSVGEPIARQF